MPDAPSTTTVRQPVVAGLVAAPVGFTSSFAVVIAGLRAVGASPVQAASGLLAAHVGGAPSRADVLGGRVSRGRG